MDIGFLGQFGATEQKTGLAVLGIDPLAFLLQLITFVILFFILKKFAFSKIIAALEERRRTIDQGVDLGREMEEQKRLLDQKSNEILQAARVEADKIISASHHEAGGIIKSAEESATRKIDAMIADAHAHIAEETERARSGLEQEMAGLVAQATEALIGEKLDTAKDSALVERLLREVSA